VPSVTLDRVFLHDSDDLSSYVAFFSSDRADIRERDAEVRTYAGGRRRVITRVARRQELPVTLRLVDDASLDVLDGWLGHVLMLRDHLGRLVFGTYKALSVVDHKDGSHDVSFSFEDVTVSIEV
jgi:hypothetical protein